MVKKEIITCPSCDSQKTKMRTPVVATIFIILSGMALIDIVVRRTLDSGIVGFLLFLILGILLWYGNAKAICTECNHRFVISDDSKLSIRCPNCNRKLKGATEDIIGETGVCPKCKTEFKIERN